MVTAPGLYLTGVALFALTLLLFAHYYVGEREHLVSGYTNVQKRMAGAGYAVRYPCLIMVK